jgi:hypothetical protein
MRTPGWYPDPDEPTSMRWWDGTVWTDRVRERVGSGEVPTGEGRSASDALFGPAPVRDPARPRVPEAGATAELWEGTRGRSGTSQPVGDAATMGAAEMATQRGPTSDAPALRRWAPPGRTVVIGVLVLVVVALLVVFLAGDRDVELVVADVPTEPLEPADPQPPDRAGQPAGDSGEDAEPEVRGRTLGGAAQTSDDPGAVANGDGSTVAASEPNDADARTGAEPDDGPSGPGSVPSAESTPAPEPPAEPDPEPPVEPAPDPAPAPDPPSEPDPVPDPAPPPPEPAPTPAPEEPEPPPSDAALDAALAAVREVLRTSLPEAEAAIDTTNRTVVVRIGETDRSPTYLASVEERLRAEGAEYGIEVVISAA